MTKRIANSQLLNEWIRINGKNARAELAFKSGCSISLIGQLCNGVYKHTPSIGKIEGLCEVTGYTLDQLFPIFDEKKKSA